MSILASERIVSVEWAQLTGTRPRSAGCNARLGEHGLHVRPAVVRLTTDSGVSGFGSGRPTLEQAQSILGLPLADLFSLDTGSSDIGQPFDFALWDLAGVLIGEPVYRLAAQMNGRTAEAKLSVPCYDTSLYIDDLHLADIQEAAELIANEAADGLARGHRSFKIKVGRGARHMALDAGTVRDIAVIRAVRSVAGNDATIMIDANNGYNLNLAKQVLAETADCNVHWMEEPFHEDAILYRELRNWLDAQGLATLIADGEGQASPSLLAWAEDGLIDAVQYDIFGYGFTPWLQLGQQLDGWGVVTAPHHYGGYFGNFITGHLAAAIDNFGLVEWDEATVPEVDHSAYAVIGGHVVLPDAPGFGLKLDDEGFDQAVANGGFRAAL